MEEESKLQLPDDSTFSIKVSENMEIRNLLRSGLFEAQGSEKEKIPLYVSWPSWLADGIVCIFAKDLHALLRKTVQDTATSFNSLIGDHDSEVSGEEIIEEPAKTVEEAAEPIVDEAREAAKAILEQPLGQQPEESAAEETVVETVEDITDIDETGIEETAEAETEDMSESPDVSEPEPELEETIELQAEETSEQADEIEPETDPEEKHTLKTTRDLAGSLLRLDDDESSDSDADTKKSGHQDLADELFKKHKPGKE